MKETKKEKVLTIIGVMTLLLFGVGATYAYFVAQDGNAEQTNINVTTHTTDSLVFEVGKAISITADQTTFAPGAGNRSDDTFARATLKANSSTNQATDHYYVYLSIDTNEFKYTTESKTAELILTVNYKDTNGNVTAVTSINGFNYVTVGSVSGFDITESNGLITIANNHKITSTGTEVDEWDITLTLVNLDSNQTANAGKNFNATLLIQKEMVASQYIASLFTTQGANNLYYHNGTITDAEGTTILDAEDGSYRYSGGDYTIAPQYQEIYKRITKKATTDKDALLGYICGTEENLSSVACTEETQYFYLAYEEGETKTQYATYKEALVKLIDDGYLLETPVKNYVCFGSNEENCPQDNLYRIIGIFDSKIKLIKADYASKELLGSDGEAFVPNETETEYSLYSNYKGNITGAVDTFYWNKTNKHFAYSEVKRYNDWSYSELNKTNLNINYLNNIGSEWADRIAISTYYVSGGSLNNIPAKQVYNIEVGRNKLTTIEPYSAKVGLMYVNDYMYAVTPDEWAAEGNTYDNVRDNNWMFLGGYIEWTISRTYSPTSNAFYVDAHGYVHRSTVYLKPRTVRPSFSLKSSVTFVGGTGTETDPYRIK